MILWAFTNPASSAYLAGIRQVLAVAKKRFPKINLDEVKDVLQTVPTYTLHKRRRVHFRRLKTVPTGFMSHLQVDLADMQKYAAFNDNCKYILVCFF